MAVGIRSTQRQSNKVIINQPYSDSDNFIDPKKGNLFAAYPVHAHHSKTHRQGSYMSEVTDQHTWVHTRKQWAAVSKIKHFIIYINNRV